VRWKRAIFFSLIIVALGLPITILGAFLLAYKNRIYPKTWINDINVSGLTIEQAKKAIDGKVQTEKGLKLNLTHNNQSWEIDLQEINLQIDSQKTAQTAYYLFRRSPAKNQFKAKYISLEFSLEESLLDEKLATIAAQIYQPAIPTQLSFDQKTKEVTVSEGKLGKELDAKTSRKVIFSKIVSFEIDQPADLVVKELNNLPSENQIKLAKEQAEKLIGKTIIFSSPQQNFVIEDVQLINFVSFSSQWDREKINEYVEVLTQSINRPAQDALFKFEHGKVTAFKPGQDGFELNQEKAGDLIEQALDELINGESKSVKELLVRKIDPEIKTPDTNRLGIVDLIGEGESYFSHSITSRIHNVDLASNKLNGILINPGETFSLNKALGDISKATGYREAYIIKEGRTVLGDGGGVCQVSTTLFRAAINTGLPIIERHPHAYRVSYYEQNSKPGFDATVFSPTSDLKFKNDTGNYILIQREFDRKNYYLAFQFYGSPDGRKVEISNIKLWGTVPPPEDLYIDDPSLPPGVIKQIDFKSWGAKAAFDWKVTNNGNTLHEKTFYSAYQPWRAIFLRGVESS